MNASRRSFLVSGVAAMAAGSVARAATPEFHGIAPGRAPAQMRLSIAAYSFREYLPRGEKKGTITLFDLCEMAAGWGLDAIEPTAYYFESEEKEYLHRLKRQAFLLGLDISGTAVGNNFCHEDPAKHREQIGYVNRWIDHAVEFRAPVIRVFAGNRRDGADRAQDFAQAVDGLKEVCDYAGSRGVFLGIENHGYLVETADDVLKVLDAVDHAWLGVNLDTGNWDDRPYENIAQLAPKAITVQVKTEVPKEAGKQHGREPADLERIIQILRDAHYRGYVALEYEEKRDPYEAVPEYLQRLRAAIEEV
jgi:sugar phosphate isomerase/epimerase